MEIKIKGCVDCPFSGMFDMAPGYFCNIDTEDSKRTIKQSKKWQPITPEWCPLKKESVTIILNKK